MEVYLSGVIDLRKLIVFVCLLLVVLGLSVSASALEDLKRPAWPNALEMSEDGETTLVDMVTAAAEASYTLSQKSARRSSFQGYCGLMASHQLYNLGLNKTLVVKNGNNQFDYYLPLEESSGGYYINAYPSEEYSMENAINAVCDFGNKDVFNVLVCFQWTNTVAGSQFGHVMLINGIVDGYVYFIESFMTPFGPEGALLICSIDEFVDYYDSWTLFEGLIHFGDGKYSEVCPTISTDLTVMVRFSSMLRTQPARLGKKESELVREAVAGEKFRAIAVCKDTQGEYYKLLLEDGQEAYIHAAAVSVLSAGTGDMTLTGVTLPKQLKSGQGFRLEGMVEATHGRVASLEVSITAKDGTPVRKIGAEVDDRSGSLTVLNPALFPELLEPGAYVTEIYAYCVSPVAGSLWGQSRYQRVLLKSETLVVE